MKIKLILVFALLFSVSAFAQDSAVDKNFEKNKKSYFLTKFSIGEDASSGWDYLVYRQKTSTKKIRVIGSNSTQNITIEDYYYEFGKPILLVKYSGQKSQYKSLVKGLSLPLKIEEKFSFTDSKLTNWTEKGKSIQLADSRWAKKEKEVLESFEEQLNTFREHLRGEL